MEQLAFARAMHVLGVVLWIGGVAMVTTVVLPAVRRSVVPEERLAAFERIENRFAWQARVTTLITGISGFYLVHRLGAWPRFSDPTYWWMHAMLLVWILFTLMLFVLEPLVLDRYTRPLAVQNPQRLYAIIEAAHWVLLLLSLVAVGGAVAGSHGVNWPA